MTPYEKYYDEHFRRQYPEIQKIEDDYKRNYPKEYERLMKEEEEIELGIFRYETRNKEAPST